MTHSIPAEHAQHDLDLIAGHAADDLTDTQRIRADALLQSCTTCADLRRDLVAIASATRTLPALSANRDFRLSADQAARLRRGGWIKSLLRPFAAPRSAARPMATAFTTLGLAGLLVANILPSLLGGATASGPMPAALPAATAGSAPEVDGVYGQGAPAATDGRLVFGPLEQPSPVAVRGGAGGGKASDSFTMSPDIAAGQAYLDRLNAERQADAFESSNPAQNTVVIGSLVLLLVGLALFGLRFAARRVG
jgi:hypothetical protein